MNKFKFIALSLLLSFVCVSCEDWLYDNVDQDKAHLIEPDKSLPVILYYTAQLNFDQAEYGVYLSQSLTTGGRAQTSSFAYKAGWGDFLTMNRHPQWRRHFYDIGTNDKELIDAAVELKAYNLEMIGRSLRLYSTLMTTDFFGDMPLSEAYKSNSPKYDTQESIYEWMYQEIDELLDMYNNPAYTEAESNINITQAMDRLYSGDLMKWRSFTYALKARLLLRKLPNMDTSITTCDAIIGAVDAALENWPGAFYKFDGGSGAKSCPWGKAFANSEQGGLGWESRGNMLGVAVPTTFFMENMLGVLPSYNIRTGWAEDPRIQAFMQAQEGPTTDPGMKMRYLDANIGMDVSYDIKNFPTFFPTSTVDGKTVEISKYTRNDSYLPFFLKEELLLIKAEATYWKGDVATARELTLEAAKESMDRLEIGNDTYTKLYRENYVGNSSGSGKYVTKYFPAGNEINLGHIMRQKYVCLFLQPEQWTDMRRYCYSNDDNGITYKGTVIYPGLKRPNNIYTAHWGDDPNAWIMRINYDPETEEKYNKAELERLGAYQNYLWLRKPMIWNNIK